MPSQPKPSESLTRAGLQGLYRQIVLMAAFEDCLLEQSKAGNLRGSLHLATGQEALPAGSCLALEKTDFLTMTYRGHGYALAKGVDPTAMLAEILGRATGLCKGQGGKMHLFDPENGLLGANGIVAGGIPTAAGAAWGARLKGTSQVAMTVFGDGALNQGVCHEVMNMAGLWKLPILFLCENNLYAEMTPIDRSSAVTNLAKRMSAYDIAAVQIDGNDPLAVYDAVYDAASRARAGKGPTFIEAHTYRTCGHYQLDPGLTYRTREEVEEWEQKSPKTRFRKHLLATKAATAKELDKIEQEARALVERAAETALAAPIPSPETALQGVFA